MRDREKEFAKYLDDPLHMGTDIDRAGGARPVRYTPIMFRPLFCLSLFALFCSQFVYGQGGGSAEAKNAVANLVRLHNAWGPNASTPKVSLTIKELARAEQSIKFRLNVSGAPKGKTYSLVAWPVTQKGPSEVMKGVTLNASGLAICAGTPGTCGSSDKPNDPISVNLQPAAGEPVRLGLVSTDSTVKAFAKIVPIPLHGEDRACRVEGILLTPGAELVLIKGKGFVANTDLTLSTDSEGERHDQKGKAGTDGSYSSAILPYKQGVQRGTVRVKLASPKCSPSVTIPWGR